MICEIIEIFVQIHFSDITIIQNCMIYCSKEIYACVRKVFSFMKMAEKRLSGGVYACMAVTCKYG